MRRGEVRKRSWGRKQGEERKGEKEVEEREGERGGGAENLW